MKRLAVFACCLVLLAGCRGPQPASSVPQERVEEPDWRVEEPSWQIFSLKPEDYGITYEDLEDLSGYPLDKLTAYCMGADGAFAEDGFSQLYRRFMEAPHTCVACFSLIQDQEALKLLCGRIVSENLSFGDETEQKQFQLNLKLLAEAYPENRGCYAGVSAVVRLLQSGWDETAQKG